MRIPIGGGRWSETKDSGIATFRTSDGHIDWDAVIRANRLADGSARNILSQYMAGQTQLGAICSLEYVLGHGWRIGAGVNAQLYHTWERERITDLLGADLSWTMSGRHAMNVFLRADNLLDVSYIERGKDGATDDLESFRGYWGFGRVISFGIRYRL